MSIALKCPNPACPFLFDPSRVPVGVVLTCPRCGMRFTLGNPAPASTPPELIFDGAASTTRRAPASAGQAPAVATDPAPEPEGPPDRAGRRQTIVLATVVAVLIAGAALAIYFKVTGDPSSTRGGGNAELRELNLSFDPPAAPWSLDDEMRVRLGSPVRMVYKRLDPDAFMAFGARDYETRNPRASELRDGLTGTLQKVCENLRVESDLQGARWLGRPARAFRFRAQSRDGNVGGVCHAASHQGVAYWSICWCGENDVDALMPEFDAARERFQLLGLRDKWQAKEGTATEFRGEKADYRLTDTEGVWKSAETRPEDEDPQADLYLRAKIKRRGNDFPHEAELLVYVVEGGGGDPLQDARRLVEEKRTAEIRRANDAFSPEFKELTGDPDGEPSPNAGEPSLPVVRLQSTVPGASGQARLIVVSGTRVNDKLVVVHAWCEWSQRPAFETVFMQIAGSLRAGR
jgi:hypothetical protein